MSDRRGRPVDAGAIARAESILRAACGDRVRTGFALAPLTTFRIGGPAALFLEPQSMDDLEAAGHAVREAGIPFAVLGKGSNVLVADAGFPGLVVRLGKGFRWAARDGTRLTAGGAMPLPALAGVALAHALAGLEFGVAIPASLGGSVRMNAGAHGHSLDEVLEHVEVFEMASGAGRSIAAGDAGFRYRGSSLPEDAVVVAATVALRAGERGEIRRLMEEARDWRRATQPLAEPNCGSVFKNPPDGHAARMIEELGLKGAAVGGATVSSKHANFIVTSPGARAADVVALIRLVQERVKETHGVTLEPEVHLVGEFDLANR
ncbi:MAG TPA: UDP-N-acetylmuramate dehydrogenase [Actinomycetota bacterium]|nr:UDP-N-acetylmuramate dehydrogenase [Actinomycetota bacterium]